jgi:hypothetical protein
VQNGLSGLDIEVAIFETLTKVYGDRSKPWYTWLSRQDMKEKWREVHIIIANNHGLLYEQSIRHEGRECVLCSEQEFIGEVVANG